MFIFVFFNVSDHTFSQALDAGKMPNNGKMNIFGEKLNSEFSLSIFHSVK